MQCQLITCNTLSRTLEPVVGFSWYFEGGCILEEIQTVRLQIDFSNLNILSEELHGVIMSGEDISGLWMTRGGMQSVLSWSLSHSGDCVPSDAWTGDVLQVPFYLFAGGTASTS